MPTISDRAALEKVVRRAVTESRDCQEASIPCARCEQRVQELMASIEGYDGKLRPQTPAEPPPDYPPAARPFAAVRADLIRLAAAGTVSPRTRSLTESAARALAEEAYSTGRAATLTPAAVAGWLEQEPWMDEPAETRDVLAVSRVIKLLRGRS